jgi:hypothetical protein
MTSHARRPLRLTLALLAPVLAFAAGCGDNVPPDKVQRVTAQGRILKNGLPISIDNMRLPPGDPGLQVIFIKLGTTDAGAEIPATVTNAAEGRFELTGPDGKGIPAGRYRVAVILAPYGSADQFKGKYDRNNSKVEVEVKGGEDLVIDIDKPAK